MTPVAATLPATDRHARAHFLAVCSLFCAGLCNTAYFLIFALS
jgi:hypothetical protein